MTPPNQPRWGKVGKQRIEDAGPLPPHPMPGIKYNMETVDDDILNFATDFMDKAKQANKPFFVWLNTTRMHVYTHLSPKYQAMMTPQNNWYTEEAGMAQLDDIVGSVMKHLKDMGVDQNTILVFSTDNGAETFTWPDGGMTPFAGSKGMGLEGGFRSPAIIPVARPHARWQGGRTGYLAATTGSRPSSAAAGDPDIKTELLKGKQLGDQTFKAASGRLRPDQRDHRQGPVGAPRVLLLRRPEACRRADR